MDRLDMDARPVPEGPRGGFLTGSIQDLRRDPLGFFLGLARDYGDFVPLRLGPARAYFVNSPEHIESILVTNSAGFHKGPASRGATVQYFGEGLLITDGDYWARQRQLCNPAFTPDRVEGYADTMAAYARSWLKGWHDGETRDVYAEMMALHLHSLVKVFFGVDSWSAGQELAAAMDAVHQNYEKIAIDQFVVAIPGSIPTGRNRRVQSAVRKLDDLLYELMKERRADGQDRGDVLSPMLTARDERGGMTNKQVRDEIMTMFLSAHHSIPYIVTWACYLLAQRPDIEARLVDELRSLGGQRPRPHHRERLRFTQSVVTETIRLYPSAWMIDRTPVQDCEIGGHKVSAGDGILMSSFVMQRDPRFYDNPEVFNPDRWTGDFVRRLPRMAYFPFGRGPRRCIGNALALLSAILEVAAIYQAFRLTLVPGQFVKPEPGIGLHPDQPVRMVLRSM
jgi:cytochrome P450